MKPQDLRKKSKEELERMLLEYREKSRQLRFNLASGKVKNVKEARKIKKDIARILTVLNEHSLKEKKR